MSGLRWAALCAAMTVLTLAGCGLPNAGPNAGAYNDGGFVEHSHGRP